MVDGLHNWSCGC